MPLSDLVVEAERVAASLDPAMVTTYEAVGLLASATRLRNLASAMCTLLAPRAADSGQWRRAGARTEAEWLARQLGASEGEARAALDTGRALPSLPDTDHAVRAGKLSAAQAAVVADAATAEPASETTMLRLAERDHLSGLRKERDRVKAAADPDPDARYRRIHRDRYLRTWTDADGAGRGIWSTTADQQAVILTALDTLSAAVAGTACDAGRGEASEAYAVDALATLARTSTTGSCNGAGTPRALPPKAIVRIDHDALTRGTTCAGETCEIAGVGPVPVSKVREWMEAGELFLTAIVTKGVDVLNVAHLGRRPTATQTTALQWRDTTCRIEGCQRRTSEWDHHDDWATTRRTTLSALGGLCNHHHDLKSHRRYQLAPSPLPGKLRLTPPPEPLPP